jgi:hypothetical protein
MAERKGDDELRALSRLGSHFNVPGMFFDD